MEIRRGNKTKRLTESLNIDTDNFASEFIIDNIFKGEVNNSINSTIDYEVVEFKPTTNQLDYNIFFFKSDTGSDTITSGITNGYEAYRQAVKEATKGANALPITNTQLNYSPIDFVKNSPKVVRNTPLTLNKILPSISGTPNFYNTFSFPFFSNADVWNDKRHKFNNEQYLYNSFLLFEFYDSPITTRRSKVLSQVLFPNPRYNENLVVRDTPWSSFNLLTPSFRVTDDVDNFRLNWINNDLTEFYVQVYFWNGLTGEQVPLIPTTDKTKDKQWVQSQNTFNYNNLYLKYTLNGSNKTYQISAFNEDSGEWDFETSSIDFYQLIFDEYWSRNKPKIVIKPDTQNTATVPIVYDVALAKETVAEVFTTNKETRNLFNSGTTIKNTGTRNLKLKDVFIYWESTDERLLSDEVILSAWDDPNKSYTRNFYTFIQNQTDYVGSVPFRKSFPQYFPIDINDTNTSTYRDLFGEKFELKVNVDRNKVIKPGDIVSVNMHQTLGEEYNDAYFPKSINYFIPEIIFNYYQGIYGMQFTNNVNQGRSFPINYRYRLEFIFTDENGGNEMTREIDYNLLYNRII